MATVESEIKKLQREIERLKKRVERLEQQNGKARTTKRKSAGGQSDHKRSVKTPGVGRKAQAGGQTGEPVEQSPVPEPDWNLRRHFGALDMGRALGIDNESIDRDLALEYGSTHEEERGA